ncbi:MAG: cobalamin B12-binding domain-containing protein [Nitrospirae bacterium]|nr:cobalamin B12-binding domain-containing protein [Nitrospirota bacterium]
MKILLIQAYLGRKEHTGHIFPLGLCYIATALNGHDVRMMDLNLYDDPYGELKRTILDFRPEIVGISLRNIDTTQKKDIFYYFKTVSPTVKLVKETDPSIRVMIGGAGFSMFAEKIMAQIPELDFGVYMEGDESVPDLVKNIDNPHKVKGIFYRDKDVVLFTGPRPLPDVSRLPMPRRDFLDIKQYLDSPANNIGIQTKRGCPFKCSYCSYPFLNGQRVRQRSPQSIVDEIEYLVREFNVRKFMFADSVFNVPSGHAEAICKEIIKRGINVRWNAWFEIKNFTEDLLNLAIAAGCNNMAFSPDAASDKSLKALGKHITEADIYRTLKIARKAKDGIFCFNIFCTPPQQDFWGFLKTVKLYLAVNLLLFGRGSVGVGWIRIEPETGMQRIAVEEGMIEENDDLLPQNEKGLERLFYSCPVTRSYADPFFSFLINFKKSLKKFVMPNLIL